MHLKGQPVISKNDKRSKGAGQSEEISAQNGLPYSASLADAADKKRSRHAPYHPVGPVKNGPVLEEGGGAQGVGSGCQRDEIMDQVSQRGKTCFYDIAHFPAAKEKIG